MCWPHWGEIWGMPEEVGKLCEEGFQITAWKGICVHRYKTLLFDESIPQQVAFQQHHYMCVKYLQLIHTLVCISWHICWQHHCRNAAVGIHTDCVTVNVITAICRPVHTVTNLASRCNPCPCLVMQFMQTPSNLRKKGFFKTLEYPCSGWPGTLQSIQHPARKLIV